MNQSTLNQPPVAWYKEPWPWILMAGPALVVVAGFFTLYLAIAFTDPLVVDNYYKEGLAINRVLARDNLALQRAYRADVLLNGDRTMLRVQLAGAPLPEALRVHFIHPTKAGLDELVVLRQIQPGLYEGRMHLPGTVRWDIELEDAAQSWRLTGDWFPSDDRFTLEAQRK